MNKPVKRALPRPVTDQLEAPADRGDGTIPAVMGCHAVFS